MKKIAEIKNGKVEFKIYEFWFNYYVYTTIDNQEYPDGRFESLNEALEYINIFVK